MTLRQKTREYTRVEVGDGRSEGPIRLRGDRGGRAERGRDVDFTALRVLVGPLHVVAGRGTLHTKRGGNDGVGVNLERDSEEEGNNEVELGEGQHLVIGLGI